MGKATYYFLLALAFIIGFAWMMTQVNSCVSKDKPSIYDNVKDAVNDAADTVDDLVEDADGETAPPDEFDDSVANSTDVDADDDDILPLSGDDEESDDDEYMDEEIADSKEVLGGAYSDGEGDYMVIAGAFSVKGNANNELQRIRDLGYPQAEVVKFDHSDYFNVCVARYENNRDAEKISKSLKSKYGVQAYVHKRRMKKR